MREAGRSTRGLDDSSIKKKRFHVFPEGIPTGWTIVVSAVIGEHLGMLRGAVESDAMLIGNDVVMPSVDDKDWPGKGAHH